MTRAVGLDPGTRSFGIALPDGSTRTISPRAGASDPARRLNEIVFRLDAYLRCGCDVVAIEGYNLGATPGRLAVVRLGEVGGAVRTRLFELGVPFVEIPPTQLKKYATGNGNASKDQVVAAARATGADVANDDEADAFWLHMMARAAYGRVGTLAEADPLEPMRAQLRRSIKWPELHFEERRSAL